jgi:MoxR-like ATPase
MAAIDAVLNKLRPSLVANAIDVMRRTDVSFYIHGAPGISKSAVARQAADRHGIAFIDVRLSQMAPEDVRGVPMLGEIDGMKGVLWSPPLFYPRDLDYQQTEVVDGTKVIRFFNPLGNNGIRYCTAPQITATSLDGGAVQIIDRKADRFTVSMIGQARSTILWSVTGKAEAIVALEEFNSAPPSVMAAAYQLILDRRLGDYCVPEGVMLLAMGNRDSDKGVTFKLPKPVANRFVHIEMVEHIDDWMGWSVMAGIHSDIVGYLARWPSKLLDFQPDSPIHSFATPRSWEMVSKIISQTPPPPSDVTRALVCGAIGTAIGTEFLLHREFMEDMPDAQSILDGRTTRFRPKNAQHATQIAYSTAIQLLYLLKERHAEIERKQWFEQADRALGYMMSFFAPEVVVVAMRIGMLTYGLRFSSEHMPHFVEFTKTHKDLFF